MANWLERAKREIRETPWRPTANTDETWVSAVTAVPHLGESGISRGGFVSFGNTPAAGFREIEAANKADADRAATDSLPLTDADYDDPALAPFDAAYRRRAAAEPGYEPAAQARYCSECTNRAADKRCLAWERIGAPEFWRPIDKAPRRCRGFELRPLAALAHPHLSGVSPDFAARLSAGDLNDIPAGDIPQGTVQVLEQATVTRECEDLREFFEERAGILEHDAGLPRAEAEVEARRITATLARNCGYLWASLREALAAYPVLLSHLPDRPGPVDALPLGVARLAVLKGRRVVRQGAFSGAPEVKA